MKKIQANSKYPFEPFSGEPSPADEPGRIDQRLPAYLRAYIFQFLDLPDLGKAFLVSKEWSHIVSKDLIWKVKAVQIKAPLKQDCGVPYHQQVVDFVRDLQKNMEATAHGSLPLHNLVQLEAPSVSDLIKMRKLLKARDNLILWDKLAEEANLEDRPNLRDLVPIDKIFEKTKEFNLWFTENEKQLIKIALIDLHLSSLSSLPLQIVNLTNLQKLDLGWNKLKELATEIGKLTNLRKLDLHENQLKELLAEIGKLTNLRLLWVGSNQLKKLPAEIAYHPNFDEFEGLYGLLPLHIRVEKATKRFFRNNYLKVLASTVCLCFCLFLWTRSSSNRF